MFFVTGPGIFVSHKIQENKFGTFRDFCLLKVKGKISTKTFCFYLRVVKSRNLYEYLQHNTKTSNN